MSLRPLSPRLRALAAMLVATAVSACSDDPKPATDTSLDATAVADADVEDTGAATDATEGDATAVTDASDAEDVTSPDADVPPSDKDRVLAVPETARLELAGLHSDVQVVRLESDVPYIHAADDHDLYMATGYVVARDRFMMMDIIRRAARGRLAGLLGDLALGRDQEARGTGMTYVGELLAQRLDAAEAARVQAYCDGVNAYIEAVKAGTFPAPRELELMGPLIGASDPTELMEAWTPADVTATVAFAIYYASYESGDIGREASFAAMPSTFDGAALEAERKAGLVADVVGDVVPSELRGSAPGMGLEVGPDAAPALDPSKQRAATYVPPDDRAPRAPALPHAPAAVPGGAPGPKVPRAVLERARARLERLENRVFRDSEHNFGSNEWAVSRAHGKDGVSLLAADGHLSLDIPAFFYQIGLDTSVFGTGDATLRQKGLMIAGFPQMAVGTNGHVAWTQTQESGDITDWYREVVKLDAHGEPAQTLFHGEWRDVVTVTETYEVRDVPVLGSVGRTETWKRWQTFDGRWIADIEGRSATKDEVLGAGEALVSMQGDLVVPGDTDHDGSVTALSFDYTGLDVANLLRANQRWGTSRDVWDFLDAMRFVTTYSQNMAAADARGNILYTGYQSVPCRGYLPRDGDGHWLPGADPNRVLDGTEYPGFTIPLAADGTIDEAPGKTDPTKCVVPFDRYPQSVTPAKGYVVNCNNDPGGLTFDNSFLDDGDYIGGPWDLGFRADTIARELEAAIADGTADVDAMARIQGNHDSRLGELFHDDLAAAVARAKDAGAALYTSNQARIDEAMSRLAAWKGRGYQAESGVETFYQSPTAAEVEDAIATSIWGAWLPRVIQGVFDDEPVPGDLWQYGGSSGRVRLLHRMLSAPDGLASKVASTGESAYCDVLGTAPIERCDDVILKALVDALDFLAGPGAGTAGGFATADQSQWLWGLRHQVKFLSLLADEIGSNEAFDLFLSDFRITTAVLPLADDLAPTDPRAGLEWFPRDGDQWSVDAANPGFSGRDFGYGSGPVMRMVVGFMPDGTVVGQNIIPGGQSGRPDSPFFADQAALWLGNRALPLRYSVADMVAGAVGREVLTPAVPR